ncbi:hypothetical protein Tco_0019601 [Tanacetum coccineum]
MKKRLGRKEYVSKQGRKNAKPEPTLDAFDDLDADDRDYMKTWDVVKEWRQSNETEELNKGSGDKGGRSFKDGDGDGDTHYERSHKGVKASANSDIIFFFTSAQDGNKLLDDERLSLADDLKKAHDQNQNKSK